MKDGHIHTPFCPHGSKDRLESYIEEAIRLGRTEISFTEHFPLPKVPNELLNRKFALECSMREEDIQPYFLELLFAQEKYYHEIKILKGFEVDYLEGCEEQIKALLNRYGTAIEDSILSTHFVLYKNRYYAIDYEWDVERLLKHLPSREMMYELYYQTLLKSIKADLGEYKPKRIGHPGLVTIFQNKWPVTYQNKALLEEIVFEIKNRGYSIDFNVSGLRKPFCNATYPSGQLLELFKKYKVPFVYGSDAHQVDQMTYIEKYGNSLKDME